MEAFQDPRVYLAAEVGFGLKPCCILERENAGRRGVFGTMHIGIGNNLSYGGNCNTPIHIDLIMKKPTCIVDSHYVYKDGVLCE